MKVIGLVRLTKEPELQRTSTDKKVANFNVAWNTWNGSENVGNFIRCVAWGNTADTVERFLHKGDQVVVEGTLQENSYTTKDGNKRNYHEISVSRLDLIFTGKETKVEKEPEPTQNDDLPF